VNKPFCDGTHSKIGFRGAEEARKEFDASKGPATT
jgi:CDGSH-type Zn-finger protein